MKKHSYNHIGLLIFAVSITLFVYGLYGYMHYTVNNSLNQALAARVEVEKEQEYKDQGKNLSTTYNSTIQDRAKLSTFFVADSDKVSYIETIEGLGKDTGSTVSLSSIVADDLAASPVGTQGHISVHLDVQGSWSSVMRTLILAENLPYKVTVSAVRLETVSASDPKNPGAEWHLTFVLDTVSIRTAH